MTETETVVAGSTMKLTCSRDQLVEKLGIVGRALSTRSSVQVLSGLLLRAEGESLGLAATDMELSIRTSLDADVGEEGVVVVPGRLLVDLSRLLPEAEVEIEHRSGEGLLSVVCGSASYQLHTYSAEDFPRLPSVETGTFAVARDAFLETVEKVARSASRDESRPVLTGILIRFGGGKLIMAATDSYRLAVKESSLTGDAPEVEAIVPARALSELSRLPAEGDEIAVGLDENHAVFGAGDVWLTSRRIDGQFPDYQQLVPDEYEHTLTLDRSELLDVIRRVGVMAQRNQPLRLSFADGELTISARTQDVGEAKETMPAPFSGEPLEIGFNAEFLRDGVESVSADEIELKLISPLRPGLLKSENEAFQYLIMPIRLAG
jgi:DNA polymerase III subunit beta